MAKFIATLCKKEGPTWWNTLDPSLQLLGNLVPARVTVHKDLNGGRFWIHHMGLPGPRKNFSWTKRGLPTAFAMTLAQAWKWEHDLEGTACPLPEECLPATFAAC